MSNIHTFIVLLRGVMPMGKNRTPMAELRKVLAQDGFANVRTYIASGNALVDSDLTPVEVEQRVHDLIKEHIGPDLAVIARTGIQLQKVLNENPFKDGYDISRVFFTFFQAPPPEARIAELLSHNYLPEELAFTRDSAYLFIPGSAARSQLSNVWLEKQLGVAMTTRNFNTVSKLIEMANQKHLANKNL